MKMKNQVSGITKNINSTVRMYHSSKGASVRHDTTRQWTLASTDTARGKNKGKGQGKNRSKKRNKKKPTSNAHCRRAHTLPCLILFHFFCIVCMRAFPISQRLVLSYHSFPLYSRHLSSLVNMARHKTTLLLDSSRGLPPHLTLDMLDTIRCANGSPLNIQIHLDQL